MLLTIVFTIYLGRNIDNTFLSNFQQYIMNILCIYVGMRWIIYCWYISEYITDISHRDDVCKYPEQCIPGHIQQYIPDILQDNINDIFQGDDVSNIFNNVFRDIFNNRFLIYCKIISTTYSRAMMWASILGNIFNNRFLDISATCSGRWSGQASRAIYSWYIPRYINDMIKAIMSASIRYDVFRDTFNNILSQESRETYSTAYSEKCY